uniref:Post-GPI attachment to proteins factor 3 n=1 Tax=Panagrellus redivivus TaxID=6233 RepID=A0A7E4VE98_PANRE
MVKLVRVGPNPNRCVLTAFAQLHQSKMPQEAAVVEIDLLKPTIPIECFYPTNFPIVILHGYIVITAMLPLMDYPANDTAFVNIQNNVIMCLPPMLLTVYFVVYIFRYNINYLKYTLVMAMLGAIHVTTVVYQLQRHQQNINIYLQPSFSPMFAVCLHIVWHLNAVTFFYTGELRRYAIDAFWEKHGNEYQNFKRIKWEMLLFKVMAAHYCLLSCWYFYSISAAYIGGGQ